ncbi:Alpha/beta hydrolase fold [Trema orientale]|uniref:Alpha/beta hydrolase fold n=1 Tax=Trema orientale TaxID=63057 RepID=A0A2P5FXY0_TREOI|nr:Alpha/beta hydrolase fold [Trema orientale]
MAGYGLENMKTDLVGGHGAWCWYKVATLLLSVGHNVTTLDLAASGINPSEVQQVNGSLVDYAKPLMDFMASLPATAEKVILVGHSLGGLSISLAMESFPHKALAAGFVTAFMPGPNLTYQDIYEEATQTPDYVMDSELIYNQGPNNPPTDIIFGPNYLASKLYQFSPPESYTSVTLFNNQELISEQLKLTKEKYGSVHRVYIVCDEDYALVESLQRWMIERNPPHEVKKARQAPSSDPALRAGQGLEVAGRRVQKPGISPSPVIGHLLHLWDSVLLASPSLFPSPITIEVLNPFPSRHSRDFIFVFFLSTQETKDAAVDKASCVGLGFIIQNHLVVRCRIDIAQDDGLFPLSLKLTV